MKTIINDPDKRLWHAESDCLFAALVFPEEGEDNYALLNEHKPFVRQMLETLTTLEPDNWPVLEDRLHAHKPDGLSEIDVDEIVGALHPFVLYDKKACQAIVNRDMEVTTQNGAVTIAPACPARRPARPSVTFISSSNRHKMGGIAMAAAMLIGFIAALIIWWSKQEECPLKRTEVTPAPKEEVPLVVPLTIDNHLEDEGWLCATTDDGAGWKIKYLLRNDINDLGNDIDWSEDLSLLAATDTLRPKHNAAIFICAYSDSKHFAVQRFTFSFCNYVNQLFRISKTSKAADIDHFAQLTSYSENRTLTVLYDGIVEDVLKKHSDKSRLEKLMRGVKNSEYRIDSVETYRNDYLDHPLSPAYPLLKFVSCKSISSPEETLQPAEQQESQQVLLLD